LRRSTSFFLALVGSLAATERLHAVGSTLTVGSVQASQGALSVPVDITGQCAVKVRGFSFAVGHDALSLVLERIELGPLFAEAEFVSAPIRNQADVPVSAFGALFVVLDSAPPLDQETLAIPEPVVLARFVYRVLPEAPPGPTPLRVGQRTFGRPPVAAIYVDEGGQEVMPDLAGGTVDIEPRVEGLFTRGDANQDALIDISDPIFVLGFLFVGSRTPSCLDACDSNDDGRVDVSDAIYTLSFLFVGGTLPPAPFREPGPDPTGDGLGCGARVQ